MIDQHTAIASLAAWCAALTLLMLVDFLGKVAARARRRRVNPFTADDMSQRMQNHLLALERRIDRLDKLTTQNALAPNSPLAPALDALRLRTKNLEHRQDITSDVWRRHEARLTELETGASERDTRVQELWDAAVDHGHNIETLGLARDALTSRIDDLQELIGQEVGNAP